MKRLLTILFLLILTMGARAQNVITATVAITNTANILNNGTAFITVNGDTRTWTNNALFPAQIQIPTNSAIAWYQTNLWLNAALSQFTGLYVFNSPTNIIRLRAQPGAALAITIGDAWASVSYFTNLLTNAVVVRIPITVESAAEQTNIASGIVAGVSSSANTNDIPTNAPAVHSIMLAIGTTAGGGGAAIATNYVQPSVVQIAPDGTGTNYALDFGLTNAFGLITYQTVTATNDVRFVGATNMTSRGRLISINVDASGGARNIYIPNNWPHLDTNGLTAASGSQWSLVLSNGSEFRLTLQTNLTLSTLWTVIGPSSAQTAITGTNQFYPLVGNPSRFFISPNNTPASAGYTIFASDTTGLNSTWGPTTSGSGSNIQPLYSDSMLIFVNGGVANYTINWVNGPVQKISVLANATGGTAEFLYGTFRAAANQIETYTLIINDQGFYDAIVNFANPTLTGTLNPIWISEAGSNSPPITNITTSQMYVCTIQHIGGQTNFLISYKSCTNALAKTF